MHSRQQHPGDQKADNITTIRHTVIEFCTPFGSDFTNSRHKSSASLQKCPICRTSAPSALSRSRILVGVFFVTHIVAFLPNIRAADAAARPTVILSPWRMSCLHCLHWNNRNEDHYSDRLVR